MKILTKLFGRKEAKGAEAALLGSARMMLGLTEAREGPAGEKIFEVKQPGMMGMGCVDLLYAQRVPFDREAFARHLRTGHPELAPFSADGGLEVIEFPKIVTQVRGKRIPAKVVIETSGFAPVLKATNEDQLLDELTVEPTSMERGRIPGQLEHASRLPFALRVFDQSGAVSGAQRLQNLATVLSSLSAVAPPDLVYWRSAKKFVAPSELLPLLSPFDLDELVPLVTNIRQARISNAAAEDFLVDSLGLADFGLPDVQLHYRGLPPDRAALTVLATAHTVWKRGLFASDGETMSGAPGMPAFLLRHELPMRPPQERVVLDLDPGEPHAAGKRSRPAWSGTPQ